MDVSLFIRHRLQELGLGQKELAEAAQVTESYISQLLARKKAPPAPGRTDLYEKIGQVLQLPSGELEGLALEQRQQELKRRVLDLPHPLLKDLRELILRKCAPGRQREVRRIFERDGFGELERLVTQKILDVAQGVARDELRNEAWLHKEAQAKGAAYEQIRVAVLEFLDTEVLGVSPEHCTAFLDPMIEAWDIDLRSFALAITLRSRAVPGGHRRFEFSEKPAAPRAEPGFSAFLADAALSAGLTGEESEFLRRLQFTNRRPSALYYYRELQNLRDPLHFSEARLV